MKRRTTMKLIGYREANFRPDNGKGEEIKGYMIYLGNEMGVIK